MGKYLLAWVLGAPAVVLVIIYLSFVDAAYRFATPSLV